MVALRYGVVEIDDIQILNKSYARKQLECIGY